MNRSDARTHHCGDINTARVVLTRPEQRQQALSAVLRAARCEVLELPALSIKPVVPEQIVRGPIVWRAQCYDCIVFVSRAAWQSYRDVLLADEHMCHRIASDSSRIQWPSSTRLACVGLATAEVISRDLSIDLSAVIFPHDDQSSDSEALWDLLNASLGPNQRILIVRGQSGRDWLGDTLRAHGHAVTFLSVYERGRAQWSDDQVQTLRDWAQQGSVGVWLITSIESLNALTKQLEEISLLGAPGCMPLAVVAVHERHRSAIRDWLSAWGPKGSEVPIVCVAPSDDALSRAILQQASVIS